MTLPASPLFPSGSKIGTHTTVLAIQIKPDPGAPVIQVMAEAIELCIRTRCRVEFIFNGEYRAVEWDDLMHAVRRTVQ